MSIIISSIQNIQETDVEYDNTFAIEVASITLGTWAQMPDKPTLDNIPNGTDRIALTAADYAFLQQLKTSFS